MPKRSTIIGLLAASVLVSLSASAHAITANPSLEGIASKQAGLTDVRWICGPYRCAWVPGYRGRVVVYPHMRGWVAPPSPHCVYRHGVFGWWLHCP